jgi:hypothetical protein
LSAQFQVFLLVFGADGAGCFLAKLAGFRAALFPAKIRDVTANILHVFRLQHGSVCAHEKA